MLRGTPTTSTTATTTTAEHVLDSTSSYHASNNNNTLAAPEKASIMMGDASASSSYCRSHDGSSVNCGCDSCDCQSCSVKYVEVTCPASLCEGTLYFDALICLSLSLAQWARVCDFVLVVYVSISSYPFPLFLCFLLYMPCPVKPIGFRFWVTLDDTSFQVTVVSSIYLGYLSC